MHEQTVGPSGESLEKTVAQLVDGVEGIRQRLERLERFWDAKQAPETSRPGVPQPSPAETPRLAPLPEPRPPQAPPPLPLKEATFFPPPPQPVSEPSQGLATDRHAQPGDLELQPDRAPWDLLPVLEHALPPRAPAAPGNPFGVPLTRVIRTAGKPTAEALSLESLVGGRLLTWIGAVILAMATAFGVHWAWTTFQIPPQLKAVTVHMLAIGILAGGVVCMRKKLPILGQGLLGLGLFALYCSAFAMLHWWSFMKGNEGLVFAECLLITCGAIVLAVRANAPAIVLIGALGGYLTPILTSTGEARYVALFVYLWFLNLALVGCAVWRGWSFLKPLTVVATAAMFGLWTEGNLFSWNEHGWGTTWLLAAHALLMLVGTTIPPLVWRRKSNPLDLLALSLNTMWFVGALWRLFHDSPARHLAPVCWGLAVLHGLLCWVTWLRVSHADRMPRIHLALASVLFTLAAPMQLDNASAYWGVTWTVEAVIFTALGLYFRDWQLRLSGILVFLWGCIWTFTWATAWSEIQAGQSLAVSPLGLRAGMLTACGVLGIAAASLHWFLKENTADTSVKNWIGCEETPAAMAVLGGVGNLMLLAAAALYWDDRTTLALWALDAAVCWALGFAWHNKGLRAYAAVVGVPLVMARMVYHHGALQNDAVVLLNSRFLCGLWIAAIYAGAGTLYRHLTLDEDGDVRAEHASEAWMAPALGVLSVLMLLVAVSLEVDHFFDQRRALWGASQNLRMQEMAAYSIVWSVFATGLVVLGFSLRRALYRWLGLIAFGPILLKVFFVDLANLQLLVRVMALVVVGVALLGVSFLYQRFASRMAE